MKERGRTLECTFKVLFTSSAKTAGKTKFETMLPQGKLRENPREEPDKSAIEKRWRRFAY